MRFNMAPEEKRIFVYDTTLRDGEQSPGASMNPDKKLRMARQLKKLGVDVIEAGFPVSSQGDFDAVRRIAEEVRGVQIAAIARAIKTDIDRAWEAIGQAEKPRLHVFISSSDIHLKYQLKKGRDEVLREACRAVEYASSYTSNVEFTAMDATRADRGFLCELLGAAINSGARTINIADTVGYAVPEEFGALVSYLVDHVRNIDDVPLSVHCHDDLGLAVANTLAAVRNGARQVKCTVNGIGERAGNAALEEVVMAIETRKAFFAAATGVRTEHIYETSQLLTQITGIAVQPNKAIVGANAFAHESGIHQDGLLKEKSTYEIIEPRSVGMPETRLVLGKHSGRHAIEEHLKKFSHDLTAENIDNIYRRFKTLSDSTDDICDAHLESVFFDEVFGLHDVYEFIDLRVLKRNMASPRATVKMGVNGDILEETSPGAGAIEAVFSAVRKVAKTDHSLVEYTGKTISKGYGSMEEVIVRLQHNGQTVVGRGIHADTFTASAIAYTKALNLLERVEGDREEEIRRKGGVPLCA
jgi:2-isopropylmalate synthase